MIKINLNRREFYQALALASNALPNKSTLPVLESFLIEGNTDLKLTVTATDQQFYIKSSCNFTYNSDGYEKPFAFLVEGKKLVSLLKLVTSENITINVDDRLISIETESGKYIFPTMPSDEYIATEYFEGDNLSLCTLTADDINKIIKRTAFALSHDEFKPAMGGYCFDFSTNKLRVVTTDSFKLSYTTFETDFSGENSQIILPGKFIDMIHKFGIPGKLIAVSQFDKIQFVKFESFDVTCTTRIIQNKYVPYESVIPFDIPNRFVINKNELLRSIDRVSKFSDTTRRAIQLNIMEGYIDVFGNDEQDGSEATERLNAKSGITASAKFNIDNLRECLLSALPFESDEVTFLWNSAEKPFLIDDCSSGHEDDLILIMPMKG